MRRSGRQNLTPIGRWPINEPATPQRGPKLRLMDDYDIDPVFGCHLWNGPTTKDGYGIHEGKLAHRLAWAEMNGPVPKGHYIDHVCRRRNCLNPSHLEPVTQSVNELRKRLSYRVQIRVCKNGHARKRFGLVTPEGGFVCRVCE